MVRLLAKAGTVFICFVAAVFSEGSAAQTRPWIGNSWTYEDTISLRHFVTDPIMANWWEREPSSAFTFSPSGNRFFLISFSGDLKCDCNNYELNVFDARHLKKRGRLVDHPAPIATVKLSSSTNFPAIGNARWDGEDAVFFVGSESGPRQLFRLNVERNALERLTDGSQDVEPGFQSPNMSVAGNRALYLAKIPIPPKARPYPSDVIGQEGLVDSIYPGLASRYAMYVSDDGRDRRVGQDMEVWPLGTQISPDGKRAVVINFTREFPPSATWNSYDAALVDKGTDDESMGGFLRLSRFSILDLTSLTSTPVFDAPIGSVTQMGSQRNGNMGEFRSYKLFPHAVWSPDSRFVALVNSALPLDAKYPERAKTAYVVLFDPSTEIWNAIAPVEIKSGANLLFVRNVKWLGDSKLAIEMAGKAGISKVTCYRIGSGLEAIVEACGVGQSAKTQAAVKLEVDVEESANSPPVPIVREGKRRVELVSRDPAFSAAALTKSEEISWTEPDGSRQTGALLRPSVHRWRKPPLVIQAYYYKPDQFRPDGPYPTAFAGQSLVSRGYAVLTLNLPSGGSLHEGHNFMFRIDAAVAELARRDMIDPTKVALVGFSRGGFLTYYAVTHPGRVHLSAAVDADGWTGSYGEYLQFAASAPSQRISLNGFVNHYGATFWQQKEKWMTEAPGFNVDRASTPTLFTVGGASNRNYFFEALAAFGINGIPAEFMHFTQGVHQLIKPRERYESMKATVDWIEFWLSDTQSGVEEDRAKYERWQKLKEDWAARSAKTSSAAH